MKSINTIMYRTWVVFAVCMLVPVYDSVAIRDKAPQFVKLRWVQIGQRRAQRPWIAANSPQAGFHNRHRVSFAAIANRNVGQNEVTQHLVHRRMVAVPDSRIEGLSEPGKEVEDR